LERGLGGTLTVGGPNFDAGGGIDRYPKRKVAIVRRYAESVVVRADEFAPGQNNFAFDLILADVIVRVCCRRRRRGWNKISATNYPQFLAIDIGNHRVSNIAEEEGGSRIARSL